MSDNLTNCKKYRRYGEKTKVILMVIVMTNCPEINVTEAPQSETTKYQQLTRCPVNSVTEAASLKSFESR